MLVRELPDGLLGSTLRRPGSIVSYEACRSRSGLLTNRAQGAAHLCTARRIERVAHLPLRRHGVFLPHRAAPQQIRQIEQDRHSMEGRLLDTTGRSKVNRRPSRSSTGSCLPGGSRWGWCICGRRCEGRGGCRRKLAVIIGNFREKVI